MQNNPAAILRVLALGDVCGENALIKVCAILRKLKTETGADVVIVNGENTSSRSNSDAVDVLKLLDAGADVVTGGNHTLRGVGIEKCLEENECVLRPLNYPENCAGKGAVVLRVKENTLLLVINMAGQLFMDPANSPFETASRALKQYKHDICIVDFHGEATSEKGAFARYFDGEIQLTYGTHTHIQTADEQLLHKGSAYITDVGMCGVYDSVIGMRTEMAINRFMKKEMSSMTKAGGTIIVNGIVCDINLGTGCAQRIERIRRFYD